MVGQSVSTAGVVTAAFPTGGLGGFALQTPGTGGPLPLDPPAASVAIWVYAPALAATVAVGDHVTVTGEVVEFNGLTEIEADVVEVLADPAAPVTATELPGWPTTDAEREALESVLVRPTGEFTVTNTYSTNQYGEVGLAAGGVPLVQPTEVAVPGSAEALAVAADNAERAVTLDDGSSIDFLRPANSALTPPYVSLTAPVRVGAPVTFTGDVIVDRRNNAWKFQPTAPVVAGDPAVPVEFADTRTAAPDVEDLGDGGLRVASFNVLNYFTTLGTDTATCEPYTDRAGDGVTVRDDCAQRGAWDAADLQRQQDKIVAAISALDADVVGLMEIENSAALGETPDEALQTLVGALNARDGAGTWAANPSSAELPPADRMDVITNAIIYKPAMVTRTGEARALGTQSDDGQAFANAREPLGQVFTPTYDGEPFLFVVNHFKSKSATGATGDDVDTGNGAGAYNGARTRQAQALADWLPTVDTTEAGDPLATVLVGDFNSYGQEDPIRLLADAGYADVEPELDVETSSYSFSGLSGSLDHILVDRATLDRATGADIWNINSGESVALEYSRYNTHGTLFYAPDPYRSSDHDPVVLALDAGAEPAPAVTVDLAASAAGQVWGAAPVTLTATVTGTGATTVEFASGDTVLGSAAVTGGVAQLTLPITLAPGDYPVRARVVGADAAVLAVSAEATVTVTASATTLVLVPVRIGVVEVVLAVVTADAGGLTPRGTVTLENGQQAGTTRILRGGVALFVPRVDGLYAARYVPQADTFHLPAESLNTVTVERW
nr:ExeM/NucH family extracellular endonuclease [Nakamurella flavida]